MARDEGQPGVGAVARVFHRVRRLIDLVAQEGLATVSSRSIAHLRRLSRAVTARVLSIVVLRAPHHGTLFLGYVTASLGLGESLRSLLTALDRTEEPFAVLPITLGVETRQIGPFLPDRTARRRRYQVNVIEVAADQLPTVIGAVGAWRFEGVRNVLRTYWELPEAPHAWAPHLHGIHEIWAPNEFVAGAFRGITDVPITIIPPVVDVSAVAPMAREAFGLEPGRFVFLFTFDFYSYAARKNPLAVLLAFLKAFPDPATPVSLLLKSTGRQDLAPEVQAALAIATQGDPRIRHLNCTMARGEVLALIRACDAYVSLHRSEGFGLGMVEAMALGRPVIATSWSGNAEFTTEERAYPIPYHLRPVGSLEYVWGKGQVWAEPDVTAAAEAMRRVIADPTDRNKRAALGRTFVETRYGAASVAEAVRHRLRDLRANAATTFSSPVKN